MAKPSGVLDEDFLADVFASLVEELLDGSVPDVEALIAEREDLRERIEEVHELAHRVAGRAPPARPRFEGYDILSELGRGGMGTVYLARQRDLGRSVALKVLPPGIAASTRTSRRFLDEARTLARLSDDRVVRIHSVIESHETLAYAMEWIDGKNLRDIVDRLRGLREPSIEALRTLLEVEELDFPGSSYRQYIAHVGVAMARALGVVHRAGVVHRDVKPSNILIRRDGHPLLADFGLAHVAGSSLTLTGTFLGTPCYASPEQLRADVDDEVDPRADIYSLGATLFEAMTLQRRPAVRNAVDALRTIDGVGQPGLRRLVPDAPRDLETILRKSMERDPDDRYATADDFADDLERLLTLRPIRARRASPWKRFGQFVRRQRRVVAASVVGAIVITLVALIPVVRFLQERAERPIRAAEQLVEARSLLLASASNLWRETVRDYSAAGAGGPNPLAEFRSVDRSVEHYAAALELLDGERRVAIEHATVSLAARLGRVPRAELLAEIDAWSHDLPLTEVFCRALANGNPDPTSWLDGEVSRGRSDDRHTLGLIAFLVGHVPMCERAWATIDPLDERLPLVNAALALLHEAEGDSARAYARLSRAVSDFPAVPELMLSLADVAVDLGDADLARRWLERVAGTDCDRSRCDRIRAELLWLEGEASAARELLNSLVESQPEWPTLRFRLAQLTLAEGDSGLAAQLLRDLVRRYPQRTRYRLALADLALRRGDVPLYLQQARYALSEFGRRSRSRRSMKQLWDVLRLGGFERRDDLVPSGRSVPLSSAAVMAMPWPSSAGRLTRGVAEGALWRVARFDRIAAAFPLGREPYRRMTGASLSALCRAFLAFPSLRMNVPPVQRVLADGAVRIVAARWGEVVEVVSGAWRDLDRRMSTAPDGWERRTGEGPEPRSDHVLVADDRGLVMFGGIGVDRRPTGATWRYGQAGWSRLTATPQPEPRLRHAAAFDPERRRVVMFGGSRTKRGGLMDDTWEFDGSRWSEVVTTAAPSARNDHAMAWDPVGGRVLLFGGWDAAGDCGDTWEFVGGRWRQLRPLSRPPARRDHNLVLDERRGRVVLFGGITEIGRFPDVLWEWDGRGWERVASGAGPRGAGAAMAYDRERGRIVMFSGLDRGNCPSIAREWDGQSWRVLRSVDLIAGRSGHAMAFDPVSHRMVMFGGYTHRIVDEMRVRRPLR